jgi:hypothetical protein
MSWSSFLIFFVIHNLCGFFLLDTRAFLYVCVRVFYSMPACVCIYLSMYVCIHVCVCVMQISGAKVDQKDNEDMLPLHYAAAEGHADVVAALLHHNADPLALDGHGWDARKHALADSHQSTLGRACDVDRAATSTHILTQEHGVAVFHMRWVMFALFQCHPKCVFCGCEKQMSPK